MSFCGRRSVFDSALLPSPGEWIEPHDGFCQPRSREVVEKMELDDRPWRDIACVLADAESQSVRSLFPGIERKLCYVTSFDFRAGVVAWVGFGPADKVRENFNHLKSESTVMSVADIPGAKKSTTIAALGAAMSTDGRAFCILTVWKTGAPDFHKRLFDRFNRWQRRIDAGREAAHAARD